MNCLERRLSSRNRLMLINAASSTGRCNTIQCVDSAMLPQKNHVFGFTRPRPSQGSVPAGLTVTSKFGFCFQCQVGSSLVLRRPIKTTRATGHLFFPANLQKLLIASTLMIGPVRSRRPLYFWSRIHMGILTDDMKRLVREQRLGYIATVCPDGTPNRLPKGTTSVWDEDHLVFANIRSPRSAQNIEHNPSVEINVVDPLVRKGYRFKGRGLSIARMKSSSADARCTGRGTHDRNPNRGLDSC